MWCHAMSCVMPESNVRSACKVKSAIELQCIFDHFLRPGLALRVIWGLWGPLWEPRDTS